MAPSPPGGLGLGLGLGFEWRPAHPEAEDEGDHHRERADVGGDQELGQLEGQLVERRVGDGQRDEQHDRGVEVHEPVLVAAVLSALRVRLRLTLLVPLALPLPLALPYLCP